MAFPLKMLAFDLGASSGKMFLSSFNGRSLSLDPIDRFSNGPVAVHDELFWNVLDIYTHCLNGIQLAVGEHGPIASMGIDSFSNDFGLLDKHGRFTTQVHCYRDGRVKRNETKIYEIISRQELHALSGNQNALFGTAMHLASMRLEDQGYLLDGAGSLLFIPDLLIYFLTGQIQAEYTIASVSQMMNFETAAWSTEILAKLGIPEHILPAIIPTGSVSGKVTALTDGPELEMISVCEHDTASAFLAAPWGDEAIIISSGTWSLVGLESKAPIINDTTYSCNIANEGGYPGHHRLLKNVMGQWIIQQCRLSFKEMGEDLSIQELMALAETEAPFRYWIYPDDERFFSPGNMPQKIGEFCEEFGQGRPLSIGRIIRCVVESLALQYRHAIEELEAVSHKALSLINIVGGGSNNRLLNQCVANATGRRVIAGPSEATALGNLLVQLIAHGEISTIEEGRTLLKNSIPVQVFDPEDSSAWEACYQEYVRSITPLQESYS